MSTRGFALSQVSSRAELERFLDENQFAQAASLERLRRISSEARASKRLDELAAARHRLEGSQASAQAVGVLFDSATKSGEDVRIKISEILQLYERTRDARQYADEIISLREAIQGIQGAVDMKDWERAAELASRVLAVPTELMDSSFASRMVPSKELPDAPRQMIQAFCDDLVALFTREFDRATSARQMDQVTRYFKLFPLIGYAQLGLSKYAAFICQIIAGLSRNLLRSSTASDNPAFYSGAFAKLFENVAVIIGQHASLVTKHYGDKAMPETVIPKIQEEVDKQAGLIIDTFWDERRLETLISQCRSYSFPFLVHSFVSNQPMPNDSEPTVDLRDASSRLNELSIILNRWNLYRAFLGQRWPHEDSVTSALNASLIVRKVRDILGPTFATLSLFVFRRSVEKAVELDELPTQQAIDAHPASAVESPLVSSLVDDVMYVFSTILSQTVDTGDQETMESSFSGLRRVLESDYIGTIQRKLRNSAPSDGASATTKTAFMIYLNDLDVTSEYVNQAVRKVVSDPHYQGGDLLDKFRASFRARTSELLADGCQTLTALLVAPQVRSALNGAFQAKAYMVTSDIPRRAGAQFEYSWHQLTRPLRKVLHPSVYNTVLRVLVRSVASDLESFIWSLSGRINELGTIALDRDVSQVIATVSETEYALRQRFVRVAQMVTTLVEAFSDGESELSELSSSEVIKLKSFVVR